MLSPGAPQSAVPRAVLLQALLCPHAPPSPGTPDLPKLKISPRGAMRLKSGHVWVYRSDVLSADDDRPRLAGHRHRPARATAGHGPLLQLLADRDPPDLSRPSRGLSRLAPRSASPTPSPIASPLSATPMPTASSSVKPTFFPDSSSTATTISSLCKFSPRRWTPTLSAKPSSLS